MTPVQSERRRFPREPLERAAKVFHTPSLRYAQGRTLDLSASGVLIEASLVRAIFPGDPVRVGIDWLDEGVIGAETLLDAHVVRAEAESSGVRLIAIAFENPIESRIAA